jgi:hypothetical protein
LHISEAIKQHGKTPEEGEAAYQWWNNMLSPFKDLIASLPDTFRVQVNAVTPNPKDYSGYSYSRPKWIEQLRIFFPTGSGEPVDYRRLALSVFEDEKTGDLKRYYEYCQSDMLKNLFDAMLQEIKRLGILYCADADFTDDLTSKAPMPTAKAYVSESVLNQRMFGFAYDPRNYTNMEIHFNQVCQALDACREVTDRFPEGATLRIRGEYTQFADWDKLELVLSDPLVREETVILLGQYTVYQDEGDRYAEVEYQQPAVEQHVQQAVEQAKAFIESHYPGQLLPPLKDC